MLLQKEFHPIMISEQTCFCTLLLYHYNTILFFRLNFLFTHVFLLKIRLQFLFPNFSKDLLLNLISLEEWNNCSRMKFVPASQILFWNNGLECLELFMFSFFNHCCNSPKSCEKFGDKWKIAPCSFILSCSFIRYLRIIEKVFQPIAWHHFPPFCQVLSQLFACSS